MESPPGVPNQVSGSVVRAREYRRRKKKIRSASPREPPQAADQSSLQFSWKSEKTERSYSSNLLQALKKVRSGSTSAPRRGRAVREAADRALAVAAKGRTRWSRAILTNRLKIKFLKAKRPRGGASADGSGGVSAPKRQRLGILRLKVKNAPAVQRKVRVLGRLVPGCRKEALPVILEEATDYISALEMQIRIMKNLTDMLARSSSISGDGAGEGSSSSAPGDDDMSPEN